MCHAASAYGAAHTSLGHRPRDRRVAHGNPDPWMGTRLGPRSLYPPGFPGAVPQADIERAVGAWWTAGNGCSLMGFHVDTRELAYVPRSQRLRRGPYQPGAPPQGSSCCPWQSRSMDGDQARPAKFVSARDSWGGAPGWYRARRWRLVDRRERVFHDGISCTHKRVGPCATQPAPTARPIPAWGTAPGIVVLPMAIPIHGWEPGKACEVCIRPDFLGRCPRLVSSAPLALGGPPGTGVP
jgi:hypothetical protein